MDELDWAGEFAERQPKEAKDLVFLGMLGGNFAAHAAGRLLGEYGCYDSVRWWLLISAFNRKDPRAVWVCLHDWPKQDRKPSVKVSKYVPGEHYHVLNTKFDTLEEAQDYLHVRGYRFGGLAEEYVYREE